MLNYLPFHVPSLKEYFGATEPYLRALGEQGHAPQPGQRSGEIGLGEDEGVGMDTVMVEGAVVPRASAREYLGAVRKYATLFNNGNNGETQVKARLSLPGAEHDMRFDYEFDFTVANGQKPRFLGLLSLAEVFIQHVYEAVDVKSFNGSVLPLDGFLDKTYDPEKWIEQLMDLMHNHLFFGKTKIYKHSSEHNGGELVAGAGIYIKRNVNRIEAMIARIGLSLGLGGPQTLVEIVDGFESSLRGTPTLPLF